MTSEIENIYLQGIKLAVETLAIEIAKQRQEAAERCRYDSLPEWLDLEQAIVLKRGLCAGKKRAASGKKNIELIEGGASLNTFRQKTSLQPCCGKNYKMIAGRRCWKKDDVIKWLGITDEDIAAYQSAS